VLAGSCSEYTPNNGRRGADCAYEREVALGSRVPMVVGDNACEAQKKQPAY
jgi:hypothetical protein